jgi:hypothetical protein
MSSPTPDGREQRIRLRAYFLWEAAGRPDGAAERHWHQAEAAEANSGADLQADEAQAGAAVSRTGGAPRGAARKAPEAPRRRR